MTTYRVEPHVHWTIGAAATFLLTYAITLLSLPATADARPKVDKARAEYVRAHYTKFEYRIPMRDGKTLFTTTYTPNKRTKKLPILLFRTPYSVGPYGADKYKAKLGPSAEFEKEGFIFAFQDVRGRFMSEGTFVNMRPQLPIGGKDRKSGKIDESTDTWDTIDWLLKNAPHNNGKVGMRGIS